MISLLFFSLVSAFAEGPGHLRGALDLGPTGEILVHRETGKYVVLRSFEDRLPFVCELMLKGGERVAAHGLETRSGLAVDANFHPPKFARDGGFHGWVRTQVGPLTYSIFPHPELNDTVDARLEAPYDLTQLRDVRLAGPLAARLEILLRSALTLEGPTPRGARTFVAHGKFNAEGEFALEGASVLVKNLFTDVVPFLTIIHGRILASPKEIKLVTKTGRWLTIVPGPELGNLGLPGTPARHEDVGAFQVMTLMGLQVGSELRLLRVL